MTNDRVILRLEMLYENCAEEMCEGACVYCLDAIKKATKVLEQEQKRREDIYECPNCLGEVHINYVYCPFCGIRVESEEEQ